MKQLLEWPIPCLNKSKASSQVRNKNICKPLPTIQFWNDFDAIEIDDTQKMYKKPSINLAARNFSQELPLQQLIIEILNEIFEKILWENGKFKSSKFSSSLTEQSDADVILYDDIYNLDKVKKIIDIEVKNPTAFENIGPEFSDLHKILKDRPIKYIRSSFEQIFGYMDKDKDKLVKYGALTSYEKTWYLKYEEKQNILFISKMIDKNSFIKSMKYLVDLARDNLNQKTNPTVPTWEFYFSKKGFQVKVLHQYIKISILIN